MYTKQPTIRSDSPLLKPCTCLVFLPNQPVCCFPNTTGCFSFWLHCLLPLPTSQLVRDSSFRAHLKCRKPSMSPAGCNLLSLSPFLTLTFIWLLYYYLILWLLYTCLSPTHCKTPRSSSLHSLHL